MEHLERMTTASVRGVVSAQALRGPRAALRVIEAHMRSDHVTGRCHECGEMSPCSQLGLGYVGLYGTGVLPRREPGELLVNVSSFNAFSAVMPPST